MVSVKRYTHNTMKSIRNITGLFIAIVLIAGTVNTTYAVDLSARIDEPTSPSNIQEFKLGFVALDIPGSTVDVTCYEKGPDDASYTGFQTINLPAGGGSGECSITSSIVDRDGTYQLYITANTEGSSVTSPIVSYDYNTSGPGTPVSYSKDKINSCEYKITYKTADDDGKTNTVEIYRSESTTIGLDAGSRVGIESVGSNQEREFSNSVPDCDATYYYVIRAYDTSGNGSGTIGDSITTTVTSTEEATGGSSSGTGTAGTTGEYGTTGAIGVSQDASFVGQAGGDAGSSETDGTGDTAGEDEDDATATDSGEEVLGASDEEKKPFFLIAWFLAFLDWIKSLFQ